MRQLSVTVIVLFALLAQDDSTIRVWTRLVDVDVVAHDHSGKAIADLTKDDFIVYDGHLRQSVSVFAMHRVGERAQQISTEPGVFSNRPVVSGSERAIQPMVILIDGLNMGSAHLVRAQRGIASFLGDVPNSTPIAIYGLATDLRVLYDFGEDRALLARIVRLFGGKPQMNPGASSLDTATLQILGSSLTASRVAALSATFEARVGAHEQSERATDTLQALMAIAGRLQGIPGRKSLLWVSEGNPLVVGLSGKQSPPQSGTFSRLIQATVQALNDANVAVYSIDSGTLITNEDGQDPHPPYYGAQAPEGFGAAAPHTDSLVVLAKQTGGRAYLNNNDPALSMRRAFEDSTVIYTLGFYPDEKLFDGKYHPVRVTVARKGIDLRYRTGYFASPDTIQSNPAVILNSVLSSPLESGGIGLSARTSRSEIVQAGSTRVVLRIAASSLAFSQKKGSWEAAVQIAMVARAGDGKVLASGSKTVEISLDPARYEQAKRDGVMFIDYVPSQPGLTECRIAVVDLHSGNRGSLFIPM